MKSQIEILFVEDDDEDYFLALRSLERDRLLINCNRVVDGVAALHYLRQAPPYEHAARPDLVLLDLNLPRKSGREVLREMKADPDLRSIPVVVLTTSDAQWDVVESYAQWANSYITKPIDLIQFRDCLTTLQQYWFSVVKLPQH